MLDRISRAFRAALAPAGLIAAIGVVAFLSWHYLKPQRPNIAGYDRPEAPHVGHQAGGEACRPDRLQLLPNGPKSARRRESCAEAKDADQARAESLTYSARSANAAEQSVLVSNYQAQVMFWQTLATIGAFAAAALAATYAKRAADYTKQSADIAET